MLKVLVVLFVLSAAILIPACGSAESNTNTNQSAGVGNVNVDANNLPEGLSTSPIPPSGNTTPGIPDPKNANSVPKGGTPTPGIPDPETLKRQMNQPATNVNSANPQRSDASAAVEGDTRKRTVRKP